MDPQQRLLLEVAWEGAGGRRAAARSGSPAAGRPSSSASPAATTRSCETSFRDRGEIDVYSNTGGSLSIAANRISYCFDFRGPSVAVDTACSSALVAVHLACQSIWHDGCPLALAGGVNALLLPDWYVGFSRMGMLSPDGRCQAFDARASGFVRSEGAGVVVLKPLAQALADGDRVYAVIRGTAVNQDGRTPGMTVPSQEAQEALLRQACRDAGVAPAAIQYVEAHGTGTPVGDPIEARALGRVLGRRPARRSALPDRLGEDEHRPPRGRRRHRRADQGRAGAAPPPHPRQPALRAAQPGDRLRRGCACACRRAASPGRTATGRRWRASTPSASAAPMPTSSCKRRPARLPQRRRSPRTRASPDGEIRRPRAWLVPLSARGPEALRAAAAVAGSEFLARVPGRTSRSTTIAANAALRRTHHDHRLAVVARSKQELAERPAGLRRRADGGRACVAGAHRRIDGRGSRSSARGRGRSGGRWAGNCWTRSRSSAPSIERCDAIVRRLGDWSLLEELTADECRSRMDDDGDLAALHLRASGGAGRALGLVGRAARGGGRPQRRRGGRRVPGRRVRPGRRGAHHLPPRAAAWSWHPSAAGCSPPASRPTRPGSSSPAMATASPSPPSTARPRSRSRARRGRWRSIARRLEERGVFCRFLQVQYAFHSAQMDPIRDELLAALAGHPAAAGDACRCSRRSPAAAIEGPELGPDYWWQNVRQTVRFADGVERSIELGCDAVVELSPHPVLAGRGDRVLPSIAARR